MILPNISGKDIFLKLKKINPGIRVLLSSGYDRNGKAHEILDAGAVDFIQKPFEIYDLSNMIRNALKKDPADKKKLKRYPVNV